MITNLTAPAARAARTIGALVAALTLAVLLAYSAAAIESIDRDMKHRADAVESRCRNNGGTPAVITTSANGAIESIKVDCKDSDNGDWACTITPTGLGPCTMPFTNPYPEESPYYPGGGTNAPAPVEDPRTEGDIIIIGTGTYAQEGGQATTGQDYGSIEWMDGSQPTTTTAAPVDTFEDYGPTTDDPIEPDVVAEDEEVTSFEYRRNRGGDEDQP